MERENGNELPPINEALRNLGTPRTETLLDIVLREEPPEYQAKVRELVMKSGIHPDEDQLILLVAAIGYLRVLIQDAPREWQELFKAFQEELGQWTKNNAEQLKQLSSQTAAIAALAQSCNRLGSTLEALQIACEVLAEQLKTSTPLSIALKSASEETSSFRKELSDAKLALLDARKNLPSQSASPEILANIWQVSQVNQQLAELNSQMSQLREWTSDIKNRMGIEERTPALRFAGVTAGAIALTAKKGKFLLFCFGTLACFLLAAAFVGFEYKRDRALIRQNNQLLQCLVEKQVRQRDCQDGLLPAAESVGRPFPNNN